MLKKFRGINMQGCVCVCGVCFSKQVLGQEYSSVKCQFLGSAKVRGVSRALINAAMSSSGWDGPWCCGSWMQPRGWFCLASCLFPRRAAMASSTWRRMDGWECMPPTEGRATLHMAHAEKTRQSWFLSIAIRAACFSQCNVFRLQLLWFVYTMLLVHSGLFLLNNFLFIEHVQLRSICENVSCAPE